jgi:hypothetical protein
MSSWTARNQNSPAAISLRLQSLSSPLIPGGRAHYSLKPRVTEIFHLRSRYPLTIDEFDCEEMKREFPQAEQQQSQVETQGIDRQRLRDGDFRALPTLETNNRRSSALNSSRREGIITEMFSSNQNDDKELDPEFTPHSIPTHNGQSFCHDKCLLKKRCIDRRENEQNIGILARIEFAPHDNRHLTLENRVGQPHL